MKSALRIAAVWLLAAPLMAHEGHGTPGQGHTASHYLTEPMHVLSGALLLAAMVGLSLVAWRYFRSSPGSEGHVGR